MVAVQAGDIFDRYFPLPEYLKQLEYCQHVKESYPDFPIQVIVVKDIPPRDKRFQFERDMGTGFLDAIMEMGELPKGSVLIYFPERWLSVGEQRLFMSSIMDNPTRKNIQLLQIVTSSPMIVSDFFREMIRIISDPSCYSEAMRAQTENRDPKPKGGRSDRKS
jgi:hypothetical protein